MHSETITEDLIDRAGWAIGEWDNEPDQLFWTDSATNLVCLIRRNIFGSLCGYVGVESSHPMFQANYRTVGLECHGGLTYSDLGIQNDDTGLPSDVWYFGFDCGHARDVMPSMAHVMNRFPPIYGYVKYRNIDYVREQVEGLAAQLARGLAIAPST